jgi:uncharacterized membrane protein
MAASITVNQQTDLGGGLKILVGTIDLDTTYVTGGLSLDLSTYFPGDTVLMFTADNTLGVGGFKVGHDYGTATSGKITCYSGKSQAASGTSLGGYSSVKVSILGK